MSVQLALYKGPPAPLWRKVGHYAIRLWTWSRWSHAELVIDGTCYSSSVMDGGVRGKAIDLDSGHWDIVDLNLSPVEKLRALAWFHRNEGASYDFRNIMRWVAPFIPQHPLQFVCYEAIGNALGFAGSHRLDADDLFEWAKQRQPKIIDEDEKL